MEQKTQNYSAVTHNLTMRSYFAVEETCKYTPDPQNSENTLFCVLAKITANGPFSHIASIVESAAISRFSANAARGRIAIEHVIDRITKEAKEFEVKLSKGLSDLDDLIKNY
jgi:hypothetical protein